MNKHIAIIIIVIVGAVSFMIGYSVAPTDVSVVRHGAVGHASGGGDSSGGYGGGGGYGDSGGGYGGGGGGGYGGGGYGM